MYWEQQQLPSKTPKCFCFSSPKLILKWSEFHPQFWICIIFAFTALIFFIESRHVKIKFWKPLTRHAVALKGTHLNSLSNYT
jgi:hypothetical protein